MITIKNIMTENVITTDPNKTIFEASKLMVNKNISSLLVTKYKKPIAIMTENDIIKNVLLKGNNTDKIKVKDVMNKNFKIISPDSKYIDVVHDIRRNKIKRFPVVDERGILVGLVTDSDVVKATRDFTKIHQIVQEVILAIFGIVTAFFLFFFSPLGTSMFRGG